MQTLTLDLKSNPEVAAVVADLEPGTQLNIKVSIKALDDQTLTVTVEEVEAPGSAPMAEEADETEEGMIPDQE